MFYFRVDDFLQSLLIFVLEFFRVEGGRFAVDKLFRERQLLLADGLIRDVGKILLGLPDFIVVAKRFHDHSLAAGFYGCDPFAVGENDLSQRDFFRLSERLPQRQVSFPRDLPFRRDKIWAVVIDGIDGRDGAELHEVDGVAAFDTQFLKLLVLDRNETAFLVFIALDDVFGFDDVAFLIYILVVDALLRSAVVFMQADFLRLGDGVIEAHRKSNQRKPDMSCPVGVLHHFHLTVLRLSRFRQGTLFIDVHWMERNPECVMAVNMNETLTVIVEYAPGRPRPWLAVVDQGKESSCDFSFSTFEEAADWIRKKMSDLRNFQSRNEIIVDESSMESFPASDPPAWSGTIVK